MQKLDSVPKTKFPCYPFAFAGDAKDDEVGHTVVIAVAGAFAVAFVNEVANDAVADNCSSDYPRSCLRCKWKAF